MAKCNTFVTIKKILGKTHLSKPYKQGLPEGQGRNGCSPFKGIDTIFLGYRLVAEIVEMDVARLRALTHVTYDYINH